MKKLAMLLIAVFLTLNFSGCFSLAITCAELGKPPTSESVKPTRLQRTQVTPEQANAYLLGIELSALFLKFDELDGYTYGDDYERFVFFKRAPAEMTVEVVPFGKEYDSSILVEAGESATVNGLSVKYKISRKRYEDFYSFKTTAVVSGGGDKAYVRYEYTSKSSECELLGLIEALFRKRGD